LKLRSAATTGPSDLPEQKKTATGRNERCDKAFFGAAKNVAVAKNVLAQDFTPELSWP